VGGMKFLFYSGINGHGSEGRSAEVRNRDPGSSLAPQRRYEGEGYYAMHSHASCWQSGSSGKHIVERLVGRARRRLKLYIPGAVPIE
jgi:hypothetical protein